MTDIDREVAAFAASLDGLEIVDVAEAQRQVADLAEQLINAPTNRDAMGALLRYVAERRDTSGSGIAIEQGLLAIEIFASYVIRHGETYDLTGRDGHLGRLQRLILASRALTVGRTDHV